MNRALNDREYTTLQKMVQLTQGELKKTMSTFLKKYYKEVVETDKYIYAEGEIPIALVAHMDTVFTTPPVNIYYDTIKNVMWSPEGLGADDRAGVFAITQIILSNLRPHIIFTTDEEIGGKGALALSAIPCPFKDLRYMIELDRRGSEDCVFYDCDNPRFIQHVERFGFLENWGSFSDISILCPAWGIAGVNLSVGYEDEHSYTERLSISALLRTIARVKKMLLQKNIPSFEFIQRVYKYSGWNIDNFMKKGGITCRCHYCGKTYSFQETMEIQDTKGDVQIICDNCLVEHQNNIEWCVLCGEAFEIDPRNPDCKLCPDCVEEVQNEYRAY